MKYMHYLVLLATLTFFSIDCIQPGTSQKVFWVVDSYGVFHTDSLERAQQEVPFTIILPTYLPENIDHHHPYEISAPVRDSGSVVTDVIVEILYRAKGKIAITIRETSGISIMEPNPEDEPVYLDISGVKVLCQKTYLYGGPVIEEGLLFPWNQNGRTFGVRVYTFSQDEGIRIVESMIVQMK